MGTSEWIALAWIVGGLAVAAFGAYRLLHSLIRGVQLAELQGREERIRLDRILGGPIFPVLGSVPAGVVAAATERDRHKAETEQRRRLLGSATELCEALNAMALSFDEAARSFEGGSLAGRKDRAARPPAAVEI